MSIPRWLYSSLLFLAAPFAMGYLLKRSIKQPEYREHWSERFGLAQYPAPKEGLKRIWIHGVSVGETRASFRLVEEMLQKRPDIEIFYTHTTPTGRDVGRHFAERFAGRIQQSYLPYDIPFAIKNFIDQTNPSLCLLMETEVWPNLTYYARQANVPVALVNGRLSERSLKKTLKVGSLLTDSMTRLTVALAQSVADARRLREAGCKDVRVLGNLKFDFLPNEKQLADAQKTKRAVAKKVVLFASTRDGEEKIFLDAIKKEKKNFPKVIWLIVPRHPQRFNEVFDLIEKENFSVRKRSSEQDLRRLFAGEVEVVLGDSMGEMNLYYGLSDMAIMGGSFGNYGSQSPIEPCALGVPLVVGPSSFNFETIINEAADTQAIIRVGDGASAIKQIKELLNHPEEAVKLAENAKRFFASKRGATEKTLKVIEDLLDRGKNGN